MTDRKRVILDVDTGIDDSLALLLAAASTSLEVVAVTCVAGNVDLEAVTANTLAVLELAGVGSIPVHRGADAPLVKPLETTMETHGPEGIGHAVRPSTVRTPQFEPAPDAIVRIAREAPGAIHLVTLGPMTNLALALDLEPDLPRLLGGWTFMGGAFGVPGNTTPAAEWNVHVDPDAAKTCLAAWANAIASDPTIGLPVGIGLDVTERLRWLPADVAAVASARGAAPADVAAILDARGMQAMGTVAADPVLAFVVDALRFYFAFHARYDGFYGAFVHDPLVVGAVEDPTLVTTRPMFVDVEAGGGIAHGLTLADRRSTTGRAPNVAVATDANIDRLRDRLTAGLAALPRGGAPGR